MSGLPSRPEFGVRFTAPDDLAFVVGSHSTHRLFNDEHGCHEIVTREVIVVDSRWPWWRKAFMRVIGPWL